MKKLFFYMACLVASSLSAQIIVLDPGHGYCSDCTQNCTSSVRSDAEILTAMAVTNRLDNLFQSCTNVTIHLTRLTSDCGDFPSLSQRAAMSNSWGADRFLSIHCNAGGGTGTETFWCNNSSSSNSACQSFAEEVQDQMVSLGDWNDRRVVEDDTYLNFHLGVLSPTNAIGCLSEIGFVDFPTDLVKLQNNNWRDSFALAYYIALQNDLNISCPPPVIEVLDCSSAIPLSCSVLYSGGASMAPSAVGTYGCNSWTESGPERVHTITPQFNGTLEVEISNYTGDLDVYILDNCDPNSCVGTVNSSSAIFTSAIAGHTYYLVVDADDGSGSTYDILVTCPNTLDCSSSIPLTCGVTYSGSASTASSLVYQYGCNNWTETGPERVHTITPQNNGTLTATLSNFSGDLDVYILNSCDALDCVGTVASSSASFSSAIAGQTYYIVVDADDGSGSAYDLIVDCPITTDISLSAATLSNTTITQGDPITLGITQTYSGTQTASVVSDVEVSYYLSSDCVLDGTDVLLATDLSNIGSDVLSEMETATVTIASNTAAGNYFILFAADSNNDITESNENNNLLCEALTINGIPDITLSSPTLSNTTITQGDPITLGITQSYSGTQTASVVSDVEVSYYLSSDCVLDGTDVLLATDLSNIGSDVLSEMETATVTIASNTAAGNYFILFVADSNNDITESNENNNLLCAALTINGIPDITLSAATLSNTTITQGDPITLGITQTYSGTQTASVVSDVEVSYYLSSDCVLDGTDVLLATDLSNIGSDVLSEMETATVTIASNTAAGNYFILFAADSNNDITESNENNNLLCEALTINGIPDITLSSPTLSNTTITQGDPITLGITQSYSGTQTASVVSDVEVSYYLSSDCVLDGTDVLLATDLSNIGSDVLSEMETATVTIASNTAAGNYFILFVADSNNDITESNENNNLLCEALTINGIPDITLSSPTLSNTIITQGDPLTLGITQSYSGTQTASVVSDVEVSYYLSSDCVLDGTDVLLATDLSNIGSDVLSEMETATVTIASNTVAGNYFILFVADSNNDITESNENNNLLCEALTINEIVGLTTRGGSETIEVFPNPTNGKLSFKLHSKIKIDYIEIYNVKGQMLRKLDYKSSIDISDLNKGIYFIFLEDKEGNKTSFEILKK